jgi:hypothetical protein
VKRFLLDFARAVIFASTVVGLYLGAASLDVTWAFYGVVGVALLYALGRGGGPKLLDAVSRYRDYPRLQQRTADLQQQLGESETARTRLMDEVRTAREQGVEEGHRQILGAALATRATGIPRLTAATLDDQGLLLTATKPSGSTIPVQARFTVRVVGTKDSRGVVEVEAVDGETVRLRCVERRDGAFLGRRDSARGHQPRST